MIDPTRDRKSDRYQDLSREQAFGVEARVLLRLYPLLLLRPESKRSEVEQYFQDLFELTYLLCDVSLGNVTPRQAKSSAEALHTKLARNSLFSPKSMQACEAILCVTDALGELGLIRYISKPGMAARDKANPDLAMLVSMAAFTLSEIGMQQEVFSHSAEVDCGFVLANAPEAHPHVSPEFFARELWPEPGLFSPTLGMPPAFRMAILEAWEQSLEEKGLTGLVVSYHAVLSGLHLQQENGPDRSEARTVVNNVTLNFDNGASFTGSLAVGKNIRIAYLAARGAENDQLRVQLEEVVAQVSKLVEAIDSEETKNDVSSQLQTFVDESKKERPSKKMLAVTSEGLIEAAKTVAAFAAPVAAAVKAVLTLIG